MNFAAIQRLPQHVQTQDRPIYLLIAVWVLSMISLPILRWTIGDVAIVWGVNLTTLLQMGSVLTVLWQAWGMTKTLRIALITIVMTWAVEATGVATGLPFGHYHYTAALQPQLLGVPILIAGAWLMMIPPSWAVARAITGKTSGLMFIVVSGLAMTAWDFFLDPQMVGWNLWTWDEVASFSYFGIPWINFVGWFVTAALVTWVTRPSELPVIPLLSIYGIVWVLQTIGQLVFWGLIGPAIVGFIAMGAFFGLALYRLRSANA